MKSNGLLSLSSWLLTALLAVALVGLHQPAKAAVTFQTAASGLGTNGGPVGLDWLVPSNQLLTSVNFPTGTPHNFEVVNADIAGSHGQYSTESGKTFEIHFASIREASGGFTVGDTFYGSSGVTATSTTGTPQILRIPSGGGAPVVFATLPAGERGFDVYVAKDMAGVFGGDLLVASASGNFYRVNSTGVVTLVASIPALPNTSAADPILEGTITVPNNPAKYGSWAGKAVVVSERNHGFYAITPAGGVTFSTIAGISLPEDLRIVPCGQNLYIADFANNSILGVSAADLAPLVDHFVLVEEIAGGTSNVWDVVPSGTGFTATKLGTVPQAEQITFSPIGVGPIPAGTPTAQICGTVFLDKNCNGKIDPKDPGIKGIPVVLKDLAGNVVAKTTTGAGGVYCFTNLSAGVYKVRVPKVLEIKVFNKDRDEDDNNKHDDDEDYYRQKRDDDDKNDEDERKLKVDTKDPLKVVLQACQDSEDNNFGYCKKMDDKDKDDGDDNDDNGDDDHGDGGDD